MSRVEKSSAALALFTEQSVATSVKRDQLIQVAQHQMATLAGQRREAPFRAIILGLVLHKLKATCKHGEWMPLYEQILLSVKFATPSTARRLASEYMRLGLAFLVEADASTPEFLALPGSQADLSLETKDETGRRFMTKMTDFVAERSLEELLQEEGIKNGKKKGRSAADDAAAAREATVQERFNEIDQALRGARKAAADKAVWMSFTKKQHADLRAAAEDTADYITELFVKTHGRAAKA